VQALERLQAAANLSISEPRLLNLALCHRSYLNESEGPERRTLASNEKLEFLGDAVLGLVMSAHLYAIAEERKEGDIARIKSYLVSEDSLYAISQSIGLSEYLLLGRGEEMSGGRLKKAILADTVEAIFGAVFLDGGFQAADSVIGRLLFHEVDRVLANEHQQDFKTLLQELVQQRFKSHPRYRVLRREDPDHDSTFWIEVSVDGRTYGPGQGKTKKQAEQGAAELAYRKIGRLLPAGRGP
jgi:ribonuclease-3